MCRHRRRRCAKSISRLESSHGYGRFSDSPNRREISRKPTGLKMHKSAPVAPPKSKGRAYRPVAQCAVIVGAAVQSPSLVLSRVTATADSRIRPTGGRFRENQQDSKCNGRCLRRVKGRDNVPSTGTMAVIVGAIYYVVCKVRHQESRVTATADSRIRPTGGRFRENQHWNTALNTP